MRVCVYSKLRWQLIGTKSIRSHISSNRVRHTSQNLFHRIRKRERKRRRRKQKKRKSLIFKMAPLFYRCLCESTRLRQENEDRISCEKVILQRWSGELSLLSCRTFMTSFSSNKEISLITNNNNNNNNNRVVENFLWRYVAVVSYNLSFVSNNITISS